MKNKYFILALALCLCATLTLGCNKGPKKVLVTGTVTVAGEKVETGAVTLIDVDTGMNDGARIINGEFECETTTGTKKVTCLGSKVVGQIVADPLYPDRMANEYEDFPSQVFTEEITVTVKKKGDVLEIKYSGEGKQ